VAGMKIVSEVIHPIPNVVANLVQLLDLVKRRIADRIMLAVSAKNLKLR
jgi:hypothetical protein